MVNRWDRVAVGLLALLCASAAPMPVCAQVSAEFCGELRQRLQAGPWDYRVDRQHLPLVENAHFMPQTERLIRGTSGTKVGQDFDYTLNKFPNHARALLALIKLNQRYPDPTVTELPRPPECYFERAIRFAPDDLVVRMIYAQFLNWQKRSAEAMAQLNLVAEKGAGNPLTHRSLGLLFLEMGEHEKALEQAWALQALMPEITLLKDELLKRGQWREKPVEQAAKPASSASAASAP